MLFPVYAIIVGSFESTETLFSGTFYWLPHAATLDNYRTVLQGGSANTQETVTGSQSGNVLTSLIVGLGTVLLAAGRGRAGGLCALEVPPAGDGRHRQRPARSSDRPLDRPGDLPVHRLPLDPPAEHVPGAHLADGTYAIPFAILVLRAFFFSLPNELMYAARVDGASEWQTFRLIVIPLARSAVITVAVFAFLAGWGDFIFALTILNGTGIQPITLGIYNYLGNYSTDWGAVMAAAVIALVPAAVMLVVAQRYIASGLTAGSVKG